MATQTTSARRNNVALAIHIVWGTFHRLPLIQESWESAVFACIQSQAVALRCLVLAVGGMPDHVHLIVLLHPTTALSQLMKQVKGVSSHLINHELNPQTLFRWSDGYAAFSMSRSHRDSAILYVLNQKTNHAQQCLRNHWETIPDD